MKRSTSTNTDLIYELAKVVQQQELPEHEYTYQFTVTRHLYSLYVHQEGQFAFTFEYSYFLKDVRWKSLFEVETGKGYNVCELENFKEILPSLARKVFETIERDEAIHED